MSTHAFQQPRAGSKRSRNRILSWVIVFIGVLLLVGYFLIDTIAVTRLTTPTRYPLGADPRSYGVAFTDMSFHPRGDDSITLSGWFMPSATSKHAIIVVHGFGTGGCRTCGFNGHLGEFAAGLQQRGFNVLSFDLRGHGRSGNGLYTFGLREKRDVEGAVDWLIAQGFKPGEIGVLGESMGGASSILAAAEEPAIGAVVTDSTFADLNQVLQVEFPKRSGLPSFFVPGAYIVGRITTGEDLSMARPVAHIGAIAPRPVLLIHGNADAFIPVQNVEQLAKANPSAEVWRVDGANHVESYQNNPQAYLDRVSAFFLKALKPA